MSPSRSNALAIGLGIGEVALGACPARLGQLRVPFRTRRDKSAAAEGDRAVVAVPEALRFTEAGALDALRRALAGHGGAAGRRAFVVLDDFWAHHAVLRGDFRGLSATEVDEVAQAYFADTFGLEADGLSVRWRVQPGGRSVFASALSRSLLEGVQAACADTGVRLAGLAPGLPQLLDRARPVIEGRPAVLVDVSETMLQAVINEGGRWTAYGAERLFDGDAADGARLSDLAENLFERLASRPAEAFMACWHGPAFDLSAFTRRFTDVARLSAPDGAAALRLMELAR